MGYEKCLKRKGNVLEMKCLISLVWVSLMDRVRNEEGLRRAGIEAELASRVDQRVLRWFGHLERMDEYRMARRVLMAEVRPGRDRGLVGWMVWRWSRAADGRWYRLPGICDKDNKKLRALVHVEMIEWGVAIFAWSQCSFVLLRSGGLSPREGWDAVTWCGWGKLKRLYIKAQVPIIWAKGWMLDNCTCVVWLDYLALIEGRGDCILLLIIIMSRSWLSLVIKIFLFKYMCIIIVYYYACIDLVFFFVPAPSLAGSWCT